MLKCSLCNKEFKMDEIGEYADHVQACVTKAKMKERIQQMKERIDQIKETSKELEELKSMRDAYEKKKAEFKQKHPDVYEEHFLEDEKCCDDCKYADGYINDCEEEIFIVDEDGLKEFLKHNDCCDMNIIRLI